MRMTLQCVKMRIEFCKETEFSEQMLDSLMMSDQRGSETDMEGSGSRNSSSQFSQFNNQFTHNFYESKPTLALCIAIATGEERTWDRCMGSD